MGRLHHTLMLLIFDCELRVSECIGLKVEDLDFDNLLIGVKGKGNKHRLVPMSQELRKILWKFTAGRTGLVFCTPEARQLMRSNVLRDVKRFCKRIGAEFARRTVHAARHTMATDYIRQGGNVVKLQRILGTRQFRPRCVKFICKERILIDEHQRLGILERR